MTMSGSVRSVVVWLTLVAGNAVQAQTGSVGGSVRDETGGSLPGVLVELRGSGGVSHVASADERGEYRFDMVPPGRYTASFTLINFATTRRDIDVGAIPVRADAVLHLALNADVSFLDDPERGDQFRQADHRVVSGAKVSHRRISRFVNREMQNTVGLQLRNDNIGTVGLYHTRSRQPIDTVRQDDVLQTSLAAYAQNETSWAPRLRTLAGVRVDGYRFRVDSDDRF